MAFALAGAVPGAGPRALQAQQVEPEASGGSLWSALIGESVDRRRLTTAMWAMHPFEPQFPELDWTWGMAFSWSQWFLASFINSYDERSWIAGIERSWAHGTRGPVAFGVGYRAGIVTGYDERLVSWAEDLPALPFAGLLLWSDAGPLGVDLYYVYRAITLELAVRF